MRFSLLQYAVWFWAMALEGVVVCLLARRRLLARLQVLSCYVAFQLLRNVVGLLVWHTWSPRAYGEVYWAAEAIEFVLTYLLVLDFWKQGLRLYPGIWRLSRWILGLTFVSLVLVIGATTEYGQGAASHSAHWMNDWLRLVNRSIMLTQAVFLLAFFMVLGFFRVRVVSLVRGLALWWFGYSVVCVALYSLRYFFGPGVQSSYSLLLSSSFPALLVAWGVVIWISSAEEEVELVPVFAFAAGHRQVLVERMELLNNSLLRIWQG